MRRDKIKSFIALMIAVVVFMTSQSLSGIFTSTTPVSAASKKASEVPGIDSSVSVSNGLAILKEYDKDGYFILEDSKSRNGNVDLWFWSASTNVEAINDAIFQEYQQYTRKSYSLDAANITKTDRYYKDIQYLGSNKVITVPITEVFMTETWASYLPKNLQQSTYKTYVSKGSSNNANLRGIYGLLTDFAASVWALNSQICLLDYCKVQPFEVKTWEAYVRSCEKDINYLYEFRYYILGYLDYAQRYFPDVWNKIAHNEAFVETYVTMLEKADTLIKKYNSSLDEIIKLGKAAGKEISIENGFLTTGNGGIASNESYDDWSWDYDDWSWGYDDWSWGYDDYDSWSNSGSEGTDNSGRQNILDQINTKELQAQDKNLKKTYKQSQLSSSKLKKKTKFVASDGSTYKITKAGSKKTIGTVQYYKAPVGSAAVNIPSIITYKGIQFYVASIAANAFSNNENITNVRIGSYVKAIGAKAFHNCKNLKTIRIDSTKITNKTVKKDSFGKDSESLSISVPASSLNNYKTILQASGISKKASVTAIKGGDIKASENLHQYYKNVSSDKAKKADEIAKSIADTVMNDPSLTSDLQRVSHASQLVSNYANNGVYGNDSEKYYRTPYGVFIAGKHTCAGDTRAMGRVLDYMGISWTHVHENENRHQWCVFEMDGIMGFADGGAGVAGYGEYVSGMQAPDGSIIVFPE